MLGTIIRRSLAIWVLLYPAARAQWPQVEFEHYPPTPTLPRISNGTQMPSAAETPDFRFEEDSWIVYVRHFSREANRPYRMSPAYKQAKLWNPSWYETFRGLKADASHFGCYCTTAYKKYTVLAGCALITTRHILTTATSTELVLRNYRHYMYLEEILGAWYDSNLDTFNSSMYFAPSRIHYHPRYLHAKDVNITHPLPFIFDLSVWAGTTNVEISGNLLIGAYAYTCLRGGPHRWEHSPSTPYFPDLAFICGFQYVKSVRRKPMPWFKYCTLGQIFINCPKTEWGWFHCIIGEPWGKYGVDSGAAWHRAMGRSSWLYDGLIAMNAFSLQLRSDGIAHYFTVLNTHPVLDFLWRSYKGYKDGFQWLDGRFHNTFGRSPICKGCYYNWFGAYIDSYAHHRIRNYAGIRGAEYYKAVGSVPWY